MRSLRSMLVLLAVAVAALAVVGFAAAQTPTPSIPTPEESMHPGLPELQGIPRGEMFDRLRGAQFSVADQQGNVVTYVMTPGTVASAAATSLSVNPNGGNGAMTFSITANTAVHARPARGSLQAVAQGDKVVVLSRQGSDEAVMIAKPIAHGMGRFHYGGEPSSREP